MAYDPLDELRKKKTLVRPEGTVTATPQALVPKWKIGDPFTEEPPLTRQVPKTGSYEEFLERGEIREEQSAYGIQQRQILEAEQAVAQATNITNAPLNRLTPGYYESLVQEALGETARIKSERKQEAGKEAEVSAYHTAEARVAEVKATEQALKEADFREKAIAEARVKVYGAKPKEFTTEALLASLKQKRQLAEHSQQNKR